MHTRSKGTLDKKVLNEYPEDRKKKDTKKESVPVDSDKPGNPQALPVVVSEDSSLQKKETLANPFIEVSDKSKLSNNEFSDGHPNITSNDSFITNIPSVKSDSTLPTQSEQESHELKNKTVEDLSSSLISADQSSFSSSEAIPSRTEIPVVSQSFSESIETVKNIGQEIFLLEESLKWCSSIKSSTPLKAFSTPEKSKGATGPVETFSAGYKSVLEDTNPFHTDNTSQKFFSPIVGPSTSNDSPYYTPNNSKLNKPTTSTRGNQESRKLFNPKTPEKRPRIDSASPGALRDAIKLIPKFNRDRESLDRYVVGLQEASEIINPELDKHLLKLSKTKLSSSVWNKVSKITFDSVKECTEYLKKIYDPPRDVYQLTGELGSIYQRCSDSVDDFADRVRGLSEKILEAYRHKNGGDLPKQEKRRVQEMALSCFVRGLKLEIKQGMKSEETLSAATHRAREIEREISDFEHLRGGPNHKQLRPTRELIYAWLRPYRAALLAHRRKEILWCVNCVRKRAISLAFVTRNRPNLCCLHASSVIKLGIPQTSVHLLLLPLKEIVLKRASVVEKQAMRPKIVSLQTKMQTDRG